MFAVDGSPAVWAWGHAESGRAVLALEAAGLLGTGAGLCLDCHPGLCMPHPHDPAEYPTPHHAVEKIVAHVKAGATPEAMSDGLTVAGTEYEVPPVRSSRVRSPRLGPPSCPASLQSVGVPPCTLMSHPTVPTPTHCCATQPGTPSSPLLAGAEG